MAGPREQARARCPASSLPALNAVLLLAILPFLKPLGRDPEVMGSHRIGRGASAATALVIVLVAISVVALGVLSAVR